MLGSSLLLGVWGGSRDRLGMITLSFVGIGLTLAASGLLPPSGFGVFAVLSGLLILAAGIWTYLKSRAIRS